MTNSDIHRIFAPSRGQEPRTFGLLSSSMGQLIARKRSPVHPALDRGVTEMCEVTCLLSQAELALRDCNHDLAAKRLRSVLKKIGAVVPVLTIALYESENLHHGRRIAVPPQSSSGLEIALPAHRKKTRQHQLSPG